MLGQYFSLHPIGGVRYAPQFPPMNDRAAWEGVSPADRDELLALAEAWRNRPYPLLTAGMYAAFVRTGSRRDCEVPYFDRRRKLCFAALHVCLTGETTCLTDVEDGLMLICEESAWAISAHQGLSSGHPFPDERNTVLDLFAAQTGMILSFVCQLLGDALHPDLRQRVRREVERRVLRHFMEDNGEWWMGYARRDLNNWTPWIISNVLMAANVWHYGGAALIERACMMLDRYLDVVPADGGCDEGAGYWNMAGGAFLDCLMVLEAMTGADLWREDKVRRMMAYPERVYLGRGWFANFADCDARPWISGERLQYAGMKTGNAALARMGADMWRTPGGELEDTPHLSRLLMRLFARPVHQEAAAVPPKDVWLPDLQVRLVESAAPGIIVAMKGGHNAENHNHNDVGSFLMAVNGDMQVVDAGNLVYTAKTFSDRRYELWNCRSAYHSVPIIGGYEQCSGRACAARDVVCLPDGMSLDMAAAYPAEAGLQMCRRTLRLTGSRLTLRDDIRCEHPLPVTWVFMLRHEPLIDPDRACCSTRDGCFRVDWSRCAPLTAAAEPIPITDDRMWKSYPGTLWQLTLIAGPADHHTGEILLEAKDENDAEQP